MFERVIKSFRSNSPRNRPRPFFLLSLILCSQFVYCDASEAWGRQWRPGFNPIFAATKNAGQTAQEAITLELGKPVERELAGGQEHSYKITLAEDQYVSLIVEQRGIDVVVRLLSINGDLIAEFDSEIMTQGQERVSTVAERAGNYGFQIKARYKRAAAGRYEIRVAETRPATENDRLLQQARKLSADSIQLGRALKDDEAISRAEEALRIRQQVLGADHLEVADSLNDLATIYNAREGEIKQKELLGRALRIREKVLGPDHPLTVSILYQLATIHIHKRDYAEARQLLQRVLTTVEAKLGKGHPWVADALHQLALTYYRNGDHLAAEPLLQRALEIEKNSLGYEDPITYNILGLLVSTYEQRNEYDKAERLYLQALGELEKELGAYSSDLIYYLLGLGGTYHRARNYVKAESPLKRALQIIERANRMDQAIAAIAMQRLGKIYELQGDSANAGPLLERSLTIWQNLLGADHPSVIGNLSILVQFFAAAGKMEKVIKFQSRENETTERMISRNVFESERQKLAYLSARSEQGNRSISLHIRFAPDNVAACELAINSILQRKGRVQDAIADNLAALRRRLSAEDRLLLDQLSDTTSRLAKLVLSGPQNITPSEHQKQIHVLEEKREGLEAEISRRSDGFYQKSQPASLAAVQSAIPTSAALIEFALYRPFDPKANDNETYGEPRYVAYVIRNEGKVRWVELGPAKDIDNEVDALRQSLRDPLRKDARQLARAVDEKLMRPVRAVVGDVTRLLLSPDGQLNLIPFEALVDEQGRYLVERYAFNYLTSGRDLLRLKTRRESKSPPVVVADPAFGEPAAIASRVGAAGSSNAAGRVRLDYSQMFFGPLPGVGEEVRALKELLPLATFHTKEQATESTLKRVSGPSILHVATHGFFLANDATATDRKETPTKDGTRLGKWTAQVDNPLLRSGLALAGANQGRSGDEDGVLTALEAATLDLWGTKLVVLSACDTGVGEVKNSDGVYGLRRALVLAGAESQLMSLWPVSDRSTRDLMVGYYKALMQNAGRSEALRRVQLQMLRSKTRGHPYYWASFILTGEWANLKGQRD